MQETDSEQAEAQSGEPILFISITLGDSNTDKARRGRDVHTTVDETGTAHLEATQVVCDIRGRASCLQEVLVSTLLVRVQVLRWVVRTEPRKTRQRFVVKAPGPRYTTCCLGYRHNPSI